MSLLVESLKIENGTACNLVYHNRRMSKARSELFGIERAIDIGDILSEFTLPKVGCYKCRIEYDATIRKVEFVPYQVKSIEKLKIVETAEIEYTYKYLDRSMIASLFALRGACDDILISISGLLADSSSANIVLEKKGLLYTPQTQMLCGTKRQLLLDQGRLVEKPIEAASIYQYDTLYLINAMIESGEVSLHIDEETIVR